MRRWRSIGLVYPGRWEAIMNQAFGPVSALQGEKLVFCLECTPVQAP